MLIYGTDTQSKQAKLLDESRQTINNEALRLAMAIKDLMGKIWNNRDGLSPQEAMDAYGQDFGNLYLVAQNAVAFVNGVLPANRQVDLTPPNGHAFTVNENGTGTVTA